MPSAARRRRRASLSNCGCRRDPGKRRTSASDSMPYSCSRATKASALRVEWPIVQIVGSASALIGIIGDFDEVAVRVSEVDGEDRTGGAGAGDRAFQDRHAAALEMRDDLRHRGAGDEAQIARSRGRPQRLRLEFPADLMKIDFLVAERQRLSSVS